MAQLLVVDYYLHLLLMCCGQPGDDPFHNAPLVQHLALTQQHP